jgi:hypothetical protein
VRCNDDADDGTGSAAVDEATGTTAITPTMSRFVAASTPTADRGRRRSALDQAPRCASDFGAAGAVCGRCSSRAARV